MLWRSVRVRGHRHRVSGPVNRLEVGWFLPAGSIGCCLVIVVRFPGMLTAITLLISPQRLYRFDEGRDRKSTRLNSSHVKISYAVFCLKKKTKRNQNCN